MPRQRRPRHRRRAAAAATARATEPSAAPGAARLLALARALGDLGRREPGGALLDSLLQILSDAYAADGPLARDLRRAAAVAAGSPLALDLGWAREQVRLALADALGRLGATGQLGLRAWLVLAVCETLAREPAGAAGERLRPALELIVGARGAAPGAAPGSA